MHSEEAKSIKAHLEAKGIKQVWIAEKAGVSRSMITRFLNGERGMEAEKVKKVQNALGLAVA